MLISRDVGQAGGTASNPQYSASTGAGQRATACGKRPKTHAFQLCPQCHGFDDYCADVATCESCGGSGLAGVPGAPFSGAAMKSKTIRYGMPPKSEFRKLGLGKIENGRIKCIAGFRFAWWDIEGRTIPLFVNARVLRIKGTP